MTNVGEEGRKTNSVESSGSWLFSPAVVDILQEVIQEAAGGTGRTRPVFRRRCRSTGRVRPVPPRPSDVNRQSQEEVGRRWHSTFPRKAWPFVRRASRDVGRKAIPCRRRWPTSPRRSANTSKPKLTCRQGPSWARSRWSFDMPKLPGVNHLDAMRALQEAGFRVLRQGKPIITTDGSRKINLPTPQSGQCDHDGGGSSRTPA